MLARWKIAASVSISWGRRSQWCTLDVIPSSKSHLQETGGRRKGWMGFCFIYSWFIKEGALTFSNDTVKEWHAARDAAIRNMFSQEDLWKGWRASTHGARSQSEPNLLNLDTDCPFPKMRRIRVVSHYRCNQLECVGIIRQKRGGGDTYTHTRPHTHEELMRVWRETAIGEWPQRVCCSNQRVTQAGCDEPRPVRSAGRLGQRAARIFSQSSHPCLGEQKNGFKSRFCTRKIVRFHKRRMCLKGFWPSWS